MNKITIGEKIIGDTQPLYFIADIGANHDGNIDKAFRLIELAKEAGADAAKFQNFQAKKIVSAKGFQDLGEQLSHQATWKKSVYEIYEDASISFEWTQKLKEKCDQIGIDYFTSPYDFESVDHVDAFVDIYKIGSGDITWTQMIRYIALKKKPVIIATGASEMEDVERAMNILQAITKDIVLMQCNTNYTVDPEKIKYVNLNVLKNFARIYPSVTLGLSDHTIGHSTVLGAIAFGAQFFEKHFTDDNKQEGPDHKFAMNPQSWREMVDRSYELHYALGDGIKRIEENEKASLVVQQRSIRAAFNLQAGTIISAAHLEFLRPIPADGFAPYQAEELIGKKLHLPLEKGAHFTKKHITDK